MSGLCGWFLPNRQVDNPNGILQRMGARLPAGIGGAGGMGAEAGRGLLVDGSKAGSHFHDGGQIWAAIAGIPEWQSPELQAAAARDGHAKALADAYRQYGRDVFRHLHGPCSAAIIDAAKGCAAVAIDRLGITQMCYAKSGNGLVFGTTTDAVRAHPAASQATISTQAVFDYLYFSRSPAPGTIYEEQNKLVPAQSLWCEDGELRTDFYWQMPFVDGNGRNLPSLRDELRADLRRSMRRAVEGADLAKVGAFMSGGLDSTTIVGLLHEISPIPPAFTIGFEAANYNETQYAAEAARHYGTTLYEYYVTPDDIADLAPRIALAYDEPFGNSSAVPTFYGAQFARQHGMELVLAGDGGNELFAGNKRYAQQKVFGAYETLPPWVRKGFLEPMLARLPESLPPVRKARSYIRRANTPMPDRIETYNYYRSAPLAACFKPGVAAEIDSDHPNELLRLAYDRAPSRSMVNRMLYLDLQMTLADDDLRKVGRMCELAGVTVRYPFLDEEVAEFAARVPPSLKLSWLRLRYFYRKAMGSFLPRISLTKPKHGFGLPYGFWLRSHKRLQELSFDSVLSLKKQGFFQDAFLDDVVHSFRGGHDAYHGELVWVLMMLALWLREHGQSLPSRVPALPESGSIMGAR